MKKSKIKTFKVKSKTNKFPEFTIEDNGLGYLDDFISEYLWENFRIHIWDKKEGNHHKTILVQPPGDKKWYHFENEPGSSATILVEDYKPKVLSLQW